MNIQEKWQYLYEIYLEEDSVGQFVDKLIELELINWEKIEEKEEKL